MSGQRRPWLPLPVHPPTIGGGPDTAQAPRVRGYLEEKLHVLTAEVVGLEELLEDAHRQGDAIQDFLYLTLQAFQHLIWAQVGSSLDTGKDRRPKTSLTSLLAGSQHSGYSRLGILRHGRHVVFSWSYRYATSRILTCFGSLD